MRTNGVEDGTLIVKPEKDRTRHSMSSRHKRGSSAYGLGSTADDVLSKGLAGGSAVLLSVQSLTRTASSDGWLGTYFHDAPSRRQYPLSHCMKRLCGIQLHAAMHTGSTIAGCILVKTSERGEQRTTPSVQAAVQVNQNISILPSHS